MVETTEDLKRQFQKMMAEEKRMLENALGIFVEETIRDRPVDEKAVVQRALGSQLKKR